MSRKATPNKMNVQSKQMDLEDEESAASETSDNNEEEENLDSDESGLGEHSGSNEEAEEEEDDVEEDDEEGDSESVENDEDDGESDEDDAEEDEDVDVTETGGKHKLSIKNGDGPKPKKAKITEKGEKSFVSKEKPKYDDPEVNARTVYVSNIPITCHHLKVKSIFSKYGKVEFVSASGVPSDIRTAAQKLRHVIEKLRGPNSAYFCYIRYEKPNQAERAAAEGNGIVLYNNHLMVKLHGDKTFDNSKAIYISNVPFDASEEDLWKTFGHVGPVRSVHIKRDSVTKKPKGFGYVNFENSDSVAKALEMETVKIRGRSVNVSRFGEKTETPKKINKPKNSTIKNDGDKESNDEDESEGGKINRSKKTSENAAGAKKGIKKKPLPGVKKNRIIKKKITSK